jgi:hypothetical protein
MRLLNRRFRLGALKKKADDNDKIRAEALPEDSTKSSSFDAVEGRETQQEESGREISSSDERRDVWPVKTTRDKTESRGKTNRSTPQRRQQIKRRKGKADDSVTSKNTILSKSERSSCQRSKSLSRAEKSQSPSTSRGDLKRNTRSKSLGHRKRRDDPEVASPRSACSPFDACELSRLMEADDGSSIIDEGMYAASKYQALVSDESEIDRGEFSHLQRQRQRHVDVDRSDTLDTTGTEERPELDGCVAKYDNVFNTCFEMGDTCFEMGDAFRMSTPAAQPPALSQVDKQRTAGGMKEMTGAFGQYSGNPKMMCGALDFVDDSSIESAENESLVDLLRRKTVTRRKGSRRRDHETRRLTRSELEEKEFSWEEYFSAF